VAAGSVANGREQIVASSGTSNDQSPSLEIDEMIRELDDWRGAKLSQIRSVIAQALPGMNEDLKWRKPSNPHGVPVWSDHGPICTGETYKKVVKLTFFKGASLPDPSGLFNSSLEGNTRRAIDFSESDRIDEAALTALFKAAAALNDSSTLRSV
jgi:hypothetical protein